MTHFTPRKAQIGVVLLATAALTLVASPATADEAPASDYCWQNADTGSTQCFADEAALDSAIETQTHSVLAEPGTSARSMAQLLTTYTLATWYEDSSYGGAFTKTTSSNSAACSGAGQINLNFAAAWVDRVSSFKTWHGCSGTLFANTGQGGASYGSFTAAPSVGALNDIASSYRLQ